MQLALGDNSGCHFYNVAFLCYGGTPVAFITTLPFHFPSPVLFPSQILSWFVDSPSPLCPFSLHALMRVAVKLGHHPGDWFGPSQLAVLIRYVPHLKSIHVHLDPSKNYNSSIIFESSKISRLLFIDLQHVFTSK